MEIGKTRLALTASMLAMALALAGCGGGGSSGGATSAGGGSSGGSSNNNAGTMTEPTALQQATMLASTQYASAAQAEEDAKKYAGMLDVISVAGNSMMAAGNAGKVLAADMMLTQAIEDADATIEAVGTQMAAAADIEDAGDKAAVMALLEQAKAAAEKAKKDAKAVQAKAAFKGHLAKVKGDDPEVDGYPMDGDDSAEMVAMAIAEAIAADPSRVNSTARAMPSHEAGAQMTEAVSMTIGGTMAGMTWEQIADADDVDVMKMRLGTISDDGTLDPGNGEVSVASLAGMTAVDVAADLDTANNTDGSSTPGSYMGITGAVVCLGSDCKVGAAGTADEGKLVGSWYFSPADPKETYVAKDPDADEVSYTPATLFGTYGYWLVDDGAGAITIHTFREHGAGHSGEIGPHDTLPQSATYEGMAGGMSVHKTFDGNAKQTGIASGAFTADVSLTATFGGSAMLKGEIDNFKSDNSAAFDPSWKVTLVESSLSGGNATGATKGGGNDGVWSASTYGVEMQRPMGIVGDFTAHFTDGHVAGAFGAEATTPIKAPDAE